MSSAVVMGVSCGIVAGLAVAEISALTPALARMIMRRAARSFYADDSDLAAERAEEWEALVQARPGNLLKLATAAFFGGGAAALAIARAARRTRGALVRRAAPPRRGQARGLYRPAWVMPMLLAGVVVLINAPAVAALFCLILIGCGVAVAGTRRRRRRGLMRMPPK